uniref:Uncharacterized protein n=1 Tax=Anopheles darlingi TaxID=43151 RepID=A0A2M4DHS0_ANODA
MIICLRSVVAVCLLFVSRRRWASPCSLDGRQPARLSTNATHQAHNVFTHWPHGLALRVIVIALMIVIIINTHTYGARRRRHRRRRRRRR